jgi:hypothetical protein
MILPTKRLSVESSLLGVGADVLNLLNEPKTVSRIWEELKEIRQSLNDRGERLTFEWFVLALDLLFAIDSISLQEGLLKRSQS